MKKFLLAMLMLSMFPSLTMAQSTPTTDVDPLETPISSCVSLSSNMRYRMRDAQTNGGVSSLQDFLNTKGFLSSEPTGFFGIATLKAVKEYQSFVGLSPTGYVGQLTRAKINATSCGGGQDITPPIPPNPGNFPPGCASAGGYSTTTGKSCSTTILCSTVGDITTCTAGDSNFPPGCKSSSGYSHTNGNRCDGSIPVKVYLSGCTSTSGWSSTTGNACDGSTLVPFPKITTTSYSPSTPGTSSTSGVGVSEKFIINGSGFQSTSKLNYTDTISSSTGTLTQVISYTPTQIVFAGNLYTENGASLYKVKVVNSDASGSQTRGSNEVMINTLILPSGCNSTSGWSSTTGNACDGSTAVRPSITSCTTVGDITTCTTTAS